MTLIRTKFKHVPINSAFYFGTYLNPNVASEIPYTRTSKQCYIDLNGEQHLMDLEEEVFVNPLTTDRVEE